MRLFNKKSNDAAPPPPIELVTFPWWFYAIPGEGNMVDTRHAPGMSSKRIAELLRIIADDYDKMEDEDA